jgi:uncharacterized membrane protein
MGLRDWLLALHVLSAFAWISALVVYTVVIAAGRRSSAPSDVLRLFRIVRVGDALIAVGMIGTIVFGIWLAISVDRYELWDGWVIAAIILWAIAMALGKQTGDGYRATAEMAAQLVSSGSPRSPELAAAMGTSRAFWTHWLSFIVIVLILVDMIWKPGA